MVFYRTANVYKRMVLTLNLANITDIAQISSLMGHWELLAGAIILVILAFVVIFVLKNFAANAIMGIIAFAIAKLILGVALPVNALTVLVTLLGGLGGVAALLIASFLGWL